MIALLLILAAQWVPVAECQGETAYTNFRGNTLFTETRVLSREPGSGFNVVNATGTLLWKECPAGEPQRVMSSTGILFQAEYFSGPYHSPEGSGFMVSVPGEILLLDLNGRVTSSFHTGEYPGSLCASRNRIWFVSSESGVLKGISISENETSSCPLPFTPLTVSSNGNLLLLESAEGPVYVCSSEGEVLHGIPGGFRPCFTGDSTVELFRWSESLGCEATAWDHVLYSLETSKETVFPLARSFSPAAEVSAEDPVAHFDVPYMHQRWDTPDWFNGSCSCGPTSCMMAVQYYNRLTPDSIWCSYPDGHWSQWGNYIPVEYTFLGHTYDIEGISPGSVWVPGSHGFICRDAGGAYWAYMVLWMQQHGLDSAWLGTTWSACTEKLNGSTPLVASTTSPYTGGHILLFNGYHDNHSVICNDSYGNQNEPGWGNYYNGKDVVYDWPGYNNGNTQLGISQLFSAESQVLSPAGTLVDDRTQGYRKLGPCQYWHEQNTGYDQWSWWTYSTGALPDTCVVEWNPELTSSGTYTVETFVPQSHATATGIYHLRTSGGWETTSLNQGSYSDQWATLGTWEFDPATAMVKMGDYTGTQGQYISFDAVRFSLETSIADTQEPVSGNTFRLPENPVPCSAALTFILSEGETGEISIYDTAGRKVFNTDCGGSIPAGTLSAGVYFALWSNGNREEALRFTVTR